MMNTAKHNKAQTVLYRMYCIAKTQTTNHKDDLREHIFIKYYPLNKK